MIGVVGATNDTVRMFGYRVRAAAVKDAVSTNPVPLAEIKVSSLKSLEVKARVLKGFSIPVIVTLIVDPTGQVAVEHTFAISID